MADTIDSSPRVHCTHCRQYRLATEFRTARNGRRYNTCNACSLRLAANRARRQEIQLQAPVDLNAPRLTRSASARPVPLQPAPLSRNARNARNAVAVAHGVNAAARRARNRLSPPAFLANYIHDAPVHDCGPMTFDCRYCGALFFIDMKVSHDADGPLFGRKCCLNGAVPDVYPLQPPPPVLHRLYTSQSAEAKHFRRYILSYNNALAMVSTKYNHDTRLDNIQGGNRGERLVSVHGQLLHIQGPLIRGSQDPNPERYNQLFFYDADYATVARSTTYPQLQPALLAELHNELMGCNHLIRRYVIARDRLLEQLQLQGEFRLLWNPAAQLIIERGADMRRENLPTSDEVAVVIPDNWDQRSCRDIILAVRGPDGLSAGRHIINSTHAYYMPAHFTLLFPMGELGWHYGLFLNPSMDRLPDSRLEERMFARNRLRPRNGAGGFPVMFRAGRLFQMYLCDTFVAIDDTKLQYLRCNQDQIRAILYSGLSDAMLMQDQTMANRGRRFVLPSTHVGSTRYMHQLYQDSMAIVRHFGKPTYFITFTANPQWPEIQNQLLECQVYSDRPDIIGDVFYLKMVAFLSDLKKGVLGPYAGHACTIEYQKRGLPHLHLCLFLNPADQGRWNDVATVDEVICAELPHPAWDIDGSLRAVVTRVLVHGPCNGKACRPATHPPNSQRCAKRYPMPFRTATTPKEDGTADYRRRESADTYTDPRTGRVIDNSWVVPYNPYLTKRYNGHINVELCNSVRAIKYIHKYIYKGGDRTTVTIEDPNPDDEITQHISGRFVTSIEAYWRIMEYSTHSEYPPVERLPIHTKDGFNVQFTEYETPEDVMARVEERGMSKLEAFFRCNRLQAPATPLLYQDFPLHYVWKKNDWCPRQRGGAIGRMFHCSPVAGERFYLRLLLTVVRGPTSFEDLYWYEDYRYETYQAACIARGIASDNKEWEHCFSEAVRFAVPSQLRMMFVTAITTCDVPEPLKLWDQFKSYLCEDLQRQLEPPRAYFPLVLQAPECDYGLWLLQVALVGQDYTMRRFGLPEPVWDWSGITSVPVANVYVPVEEAATAASLQSQLNTDQLQCFETIVATIRNSPATAHFYLQGPGGTGKTFLYKTICHYMRGLGKSVLCVASTGIAALLLPDGRTSHSRFGIPIQLDSQSICNIARGTAAGQLLHDADLIIWDEVPMQHKHCFEAVHRLLCDMRGTPDSVLFGGVPTILGGDFSQILPVMPGEERPAIVYACLQRSFIWPRLQLLHLQQNMRVLGGAHDAEFITWITSIPFSPSMTPMATIPHYVTLPACIDNLIAAIYPPTLLIRAATDFRLFASTVLLTATNAIVSELNHTVLTMFPGSAKLYLSHDSADWNEREEGMHVLPIEHLQGVEHASLPPHALQVKIGAPLILMRNLNPSIGLCNGTRMVVVATHKWSLQVRLLSGQFCGEMRIIPRVTIHSNEGDFPYIHRRNQFPVRLCFAMTINKSQGQSFSTVGVDLRSPCFSHGQFYVAMSRTSRVSGLHVLLKDPNSRMTVNVTYPEVLIKPNS